MLLQFLLLVAGVAAAAPAGHTWFGHKVAAAAVDYWVLFLLLLAAAAAVAVAAAAAGVVSGWPYVN